MTKFTTKREEMMNLTREALDVERERIVRAYYPDILKTIESAAKAGKHDIIVSVKTSKLVNASAVIIDRLDEDDFTVSYCDSMCESPDVDLIKVSWTERPDKN